MRDDLRHTLSVWAFYLRVGVQRQLEYRWNLISFLIFIPLQYTFGVWMLRVLCERFQPLAGWSADQITLLYGLALVSHGLQVALAVPVWFIDDMVVQARFDRLLLRPMGVYRQLLVSYPNLIGVIDLVPGTVMLALAWRRVGLAASPANIAVVVAVLAGATLIRIGVYTLLGTIAFWTGRSGSAVDLASALFERGGFFPLAIYPLALQAVLSLAIPVGFVAFYPTADLLGIGGDGRLPFAWAGWTPLVGILTFGLGLTAFRRGLRRYSGSGS